MTFCIGIRFLVKPSTEREETAAKGAALDWKGIAVSLFFGLTIGFGTGFVGSGSGMMMLVVFTAFLGMELKSAVGTSTFIMTFTALIASVSHILIHPAILLERWPVLALCMAVATAASLVSARFANRVDSRTVGRVTGVVLTVLGAALILLHYWDLIAAQPLALFAAIVYPVLWLLQSWSEYDNLFVQKKPGEIKKSLLLLFLTDGALVALCWGGFDLPWIAVAAILMWGSGDGAAALMGHRFGRHHVKLPLADQKKTWEGSAAMLAVSTAVGTITMLVLTAMPCFHCLLMALAASIFGAYTELISWGGDDTVTVPVVNTAVLLALYFLQTNMIP